MHELAIVKNLIKIVHMEYLKGSYNTEIIKIIFIVGKMNAIIPESLKLNFKIAKNNYDYMKNTELIIEEKPIIIKCRDCNEEKEINEPNFLCQKCGSGSLEIIQGKEMFVASFDLL